MQTQKEARDNVRGPLRPRVLGTINGSKERHVPSCMCLPLRWKDWRDFLLRISLRATETRWASLTGDTRGVTFNICRERRSRRESERGYRETNRGSLPDRACYKTRVGWVGDSMRAKLIRPPTLLSQVKCTHTTHTHTHTHTHNTRGRAGLFLIMVFI